MRIKRADFHILTRYLIVHTKHTSSMEAWFYAQFSDIASPHVHDHTDIAILSFVFNLMFDYILLLLLLLLFFPILYGE